ncbi:H-NS histone family protein [Burkholderia multivorans]|uniref:H-NS histone family protein n=1 Tax=Burkholderia multivorans TaxID=87883 RepID=UPI0009BD0500|nr:H-NS histone family protein [Burkholderia multivorans]MBU9242157.1 H-NS histone family protein [Burkholderia multivorans]MBU9258710.1 H-NS histone family protein [Burkholderia multivorans]MCO1371131.1 H-NS histone family protein [Burkholderia multivorans]MCO1457612.1 H-NS histone family protein [Burkholderia multivorans]MDN7761006.1 H-NS histone family protein [Burkholderia multivorans]
MSTYKELLAQRAQLEEQIEAKRQEEISAVVAQIRGLMAEYRLTVDDIAPPRGRGGMRTRKHPPPKYLDPRTGATWSGRGRAPSWLGKNPTRFLIDAEAS